jgi:hypothetical protein
MVEEYSILKAENCTASVFMVGEFSSTVEMATACLSEISVNFYQIIWLHISKDNHVQCILFAFPITVFP